MVDDAFNVKLIEVNTNPALHKNDSLYLQELFPKLVADTLDIALSTNDMAGEDSDELRKAISSGKHGVFEKIFEA